MKKFIDKMKNVLSYLMNRAEEEVTEATSSNPVFGFVKKLEAWLRSQGARIHKDVDMLLTMYLSVLKTVFLMFSIPIALPITLVIGIPMIIKAKDKVQALEDVVVQGIATSIMGTEALTTVMAISVLCYFGAEALPAVVMFLFLEHAIFGKGSLLSKVGSFSMAALFLLTAITPIGVILGAYCYVLIGIARLLEVDNPLETFFGMEECMEAA